MTAEHAYRATEELLKAYERGDLHGGNPMQHIQAYRKEGIEQALKDAAERAKLGYDPINQVYSVDKQSILETPLN